MWRNETNSRSARWSRTTTIASATLARIGATWSVSTTGASFGASARRAAASSCSGRTRSSGSGTSERNGSSGPATRGTIRSARRIRAENAPAASLKVLHSSSRREQQVALLEAQQVLVEVEVGRRGEQPARLQLDQGGSDEQELGRDVEIEGLEPLELGEVLVDDRGERQLPQVDLLAQDEVQQEVERPFVDGGVDLVSHVGSEGIGRLGASRALYDPPDGKGLLGHPAHR